MSSLFACIDPQVLERHARALLPDKEADQLDQHISTCRSCAAAYEGNFRGLLGVLREAAQRVPIPDTTLIQALKAQYRTIAKAPVDNATLSTWSSASSIADAPPVAAGLELGRELLAPPQLRDEIGRLGSYRVLRLLGMGGMGAVFAGEDAVGRGTALKVMKPDIATRPSARNRFLREARAQAVLDHQNVVPLWYVGEDRGIPFIAMPLLLGESLDARLKREGKLPWGVAVEITRQSLCGLAAAHSLPLFHRDVKPHNIWLQGKENGALCVKLLDFGLATALDSDEQITQSGAIMGTPGYMAPEQARGEKTDARADLFAIGCVLYRMLTGVGPFAAPNVMAILTRTVCDEPRPVTELAPTVPSRLADLVGSLLAKDPALRPEAATAVATELEELLKFPDLAAGPPIPMPQAAAAPADLAAKSTRQPVAYESRKWFGSRRRLRLGMLGALILCGVTIIIYNNRGEPTKLNSEGSHEFTFKQDNNGNPIILIKPLPSVTPVTPPQPALEWMPRKIDLNEPLLGHAEQINALAFASNGLLASGDHAGHVRLWDLKKETFAALPRHDSHVWSLAFSPDGKRLANCGGPKASIWNCIPPSGSIYFTGFASHVEGVAFDGKHLATAATNSGTLCLWNVESGEKKAEWLQTDVKGVAFHPDGHLLASGGHDDVRLWDLNKLQKDPIKIFPALLVVQVAFSSDGSLLASAGEKSVRIFDVAKREEIAELPHETQVYSVAFHPKGRWLASGSIDGTVRLWDIQTRTAAIIARHKSARAVQVVAVAFSPDGQFLASGGGDQVIRLSKAPDMKAKWPPHDEPTLPSVPAPKNGNLSPPEKNSPTYEDTLAFSYLLVNAATKEGVAVNPSGNPLAAPIEQASRWTIQNMGSNRYAFSLADPSKYETDFFDWRDDSTLYLQPRQIGWLKADEARGEFSLKATGKGGEGFSLAIDESKKNPTERLRLSKIGGNSARWVLVRVPNYFLVNSSTGEAASIGPGRQVVAVSPQRALPWSVANVGNHRFTFSVPGPAAPREKYLDFSGEHRMLLGAFGDGVMWLKKDCHDGSFALQVHVPNNPWHGHYLAVEESRTDPDSRFCLRKDFAATARWRLLKAEKE